MNSFLPFLLMLALINSCIELEISAPSFPDIMTQLQVSQGMVGLTITYNLIGLCVASLIYGPLSECYGRRRTMLIGNGILVIGAIGCVVAPSIEWLLLSRFVQGFGAATSAVVVSAIIADVYSTKKATKLYGIMNAVFSSMMAMAPVAGGFIGALVGWRGNYAVVAIICTISWFLLFFFLRETHPTHTKIKFSKIMLDYKKLGSSLLFLSAAAVPSLEYGCYMAFVAIAPFIYMQVFQVDLWTYTLHQGFIVAIFAITSMLAEPITAYCGSIRTITLSLELFFLGATMMLIADNPMLLTATMSLCSIGFALSYPIIFARSLEIFPELKGTASSAIMSFRYLICSSVTGLASYCYNGQPISLAVVNWAGMAIVLGLTLYLIPRV